MDRLNFSTEQPKKEHPRFSYERLRQRIELISDEINAELSQQQGIQGFLNQEGRIDMGSYMHRRGVAIENEPAAQQQLARDLSKIKEKEIRMFSANNEQVQANYHVQSPEALITIRREIQNRSKSNQCEMAVFGLFHTFFKETYIVVRASEYDDYFNGVDTVLVNRKTGAVICAFDEVHEHPSSDRKEDKERKILERIEQGGTKLDYGFRIQDGAIQEGIIRNLPLFYLSLNQHELEQLLADTSPATEGDPTQTERKLMEKLIASLEQQYQTVSTHNVSPQVVDNLQSFQESVAHMKTMISRPNVPSGEPEDKRQAA